MSTWMLLALACRPADEAKPVDDTSAPAPDSADDTAPVDDSGGGTTDDSGPPPDTGTGGGPRGCADAPSGSPFEQTSLAAADFVIEGISIRGADYGIGDVDGDGAEDLSAAGVVGADAIYGVWSAAALLGGTADPMAPDLACAPDFTAARGTGDLDGDGLGDLVASVDADASANAYATWYSARDVLAGNCAGEQLSPYGIAGTRAVGDVDGDGYADAWLLLSDTWHLYLGSATGPVDSGLDHDDDDDLVWADVDGDGVVDFLVGDGDSVEAWSGRDASFLGFHGVPATAFDRDGVAVVEVIDWQIGLRRADRAGWDIAGIGRAESPWRLETSAWTGDGSELPIRQLAVPNTAARYLTNVGDLDGDGNDEAAYWLDDFWGGDAVCLLDGADTETRLSSVGLRCFDEPAQAVLGADVDGDGRSDLLLAADDAVRTYVILGRPWRDCDCDDDGALSTVCAGVDEADDDATKSPFVREDPDDGIDDDGDGLVDEDALTTGRLRDGALIRYPDCPRGAPAAGARWLPDVDGDGEDELAYEAACADGTVLAVTSAERGPAYEQEVPSLGIAAPRDWAAWEGEMLVAAGYLEVATPAVDATFAGTWVYLPATAIPATGDLDGDGLDEVLIHADDGYGGWTDAVWPGTAAVAANAFATVPFDAERSSCGATVSDLDGDGVAELVVCSEDRPDGEVRVATADQALAGTMDEAPAWRFAGSAATQLLGPTDGDGDGYLDLVLLRDDPAGLDVWRGGSIPTDDAGFVVDLSLTPDEAAEDVDAAAAASGHAFVPSGDRIDVVPLSGSGVDTFSGAGAIGLASEGNVAVTDVRVDGDRVRLLYDTDERTLAGEGWAGFGEAELLF